MEFLIGLLLFNLFDNDDNDEEEEYTKSTNKTGKKSYIIITVKLKNDNKSLIGKLPVVYLDMETTIFVLKDVVITEENYENLTAKGYPKSGEFIKEYALKEDMIEKASAYKKSA